MKKNSIFHFTGRRFHLFSENAFNSCVRKIEISAMFGWTAQQQTLQRFLSFAISFVIAPTMHEYKNLSSIIIRDNPYAIRERVENHFLLHPRKVLRTFSQFRKRRLLY